MDAPDEKKIAEVNKNISDISEDPSLDSREKAEKIAKELNSIGFDKVDETTVLGFTDQKLKLFKWMALKNCIVVVMTPRDKAIMVMGHGGQRSLCLLMKLVINWLFVRAGEIR